jgi:ABC-type sulfate/molybdate transport systems ATPase subunit
MTLAVDAAVIRNGWSVFAQFVVAAGEVAGVTGDIGSGKSTLLRLIAGEERASLGSVRFESSIWDDASAGVFVPPAKRPVRYLPQRPNLVPDAPAATQADPTLLAGLGLPPDVVARDGWTLSRGEAQRVALAAAVGAEPDVLVLDDPFAALDVRAGRVARAWLAERLRVRVGITVLVVSDPTDLERFTGTIVSLP